MVMVRFPNKAVERQALGWLTGRFSYTSRADGVMLLPEIALPALAHEGIPFSVQGRATYADIIAPLRNPPAATV